MIRGKPALALLIALGIALTVLTTPMASRAQVPDVTGSCVSNCPGASGVVSAERQAQLDRNHATHATHVQWYNEVERRWNDAKKKAQDLSDKGQKALGKGDCDAAFSDFQLEITTFSVDLTPRGDLVDANLGSQLYALRIQQQNSIRNAQTRLASARSSCVPAHPATASPAPAKRAADTAAAPLTPSRDVYITSFSVTGDVHLDMGGGRKLFGNNMANVRLGPGARFIVGPGGRATLGLTDGSSIQLGPNSELDFEDLKFLSEPDSLAVRLTIGTLRLVHSVLVRLDALSPPPKREPHIKLPVGDLGFRGTDVECQVTPDGSGYIKVFSGDAVLTPSAGAAIELGAGQMVTFSGSRRISAPKSFDNNAYLPSDVPRSPPAK